MAVSVKEQRIIDSNKRALIKYTIFSDDGTPSGNTGLVDVSTLAFALNTSGQIMTGNTNPRSSYRVGIKRVFGYGANVNSGIVTLRWNDAANTEILSVGSGNFDINFDPSGDGAVIPNPFPRANADGDIIYSTNINAGAFVTLFLELKKDPSDYDQGQSARPSDFNFGQFGIK